MTDEKKTKRELLAELAALRRQVEACKAIERKVEAQEAAIERARAELRDERQERERITAALRESEERSHRLTEHSPSAIAIHIRGRFLYVNPVAATLLGASNAEELIGKPVFDIIHPDYHEVARERIRRNEEYHEQTPLMELKFLRLDGQAIDVVVTGIPIDFRGKAAIMIILRDVTEAKRIEKTLRLTQFSVDNSSTPTFWISSQSRLLRVNRAACEFLGYSEEELLSMSVHDLEPQSHPEVWPERWRELKEHGSMTLEIQPRTKSGMILQGEVSVNYLEFDGEEYIFAFVRDITERKQAEEALWQSEALFRAVFEKAAVGVVLIDVQTRRYVNVNPAFLGMLGYPCEEFLQMGPAEVSHPADWLSELKLLGRLLQGTIDHYRMEKRYIRKNGGILWGRTMTSLVRNSSGIPEYCISIVEDITKRKGMEEALRESERQLRFLSSRLLSAQEEERKKIAGEVHDSIGSSLTGLKINLENTLDQLDTVPVSPESLRALIGMTQDSIRECRRIMTDLRPSILDHYGIVVTIGWFCDQFRTIYPHFDLHVETDINEDEIPELLKITIFRITQEAFHNIAKYSRATIVRLKLRKKAGLIRLKIEDNGVGFDVKSSLSAACTTRGLGLPSMKERAHLSGGSFSVKSRNGEGTSLLAAWRCAS